MPYKNQKIGLFIPTLNAGELWREVMQAIAKQTIEVDKKIIVDCCSTDNTIGIVKEYGFDIHQIQPQEFDHGKTRNLAFQLCADCDIIIFITQDVILNDEDTLSNLLSSFDNADIICSYGKQVPHFNATPISKFERLMNYGEKEIVQEKSAIKELGYGVCFCSNAFAAYRVKDALQAGGFPEKVIFGEDACLTAKLILQDRKVLYNPKAVVRHSHNYSLLQQFRRYFDIGVFFRQEEWISNSFGKPQGKAVKFTLGGLAFLFPRKIWWIPQYSLLIMAKFAGFKLGKMHRLLPKKVIGWFTMNPSYWKRVA